MTTTNMRDIDLILRPRGQGHVNLKLARDLDEVAGKVKKKYSKPELSFLSLACSEV